MVGVVQDGGIVPRRYTVGNTNTTCQDHPFISTLRLMKRRCKV